jgi:hypothetical protein
VAERNGLLNRRTGHTVPWVRIPLSPQNPAIVMDGGVLVFKRVAIFFSQHLQKKLKAQNSICNRDLKPQDKKESKKWAKPL